MLNVSAEERITVEEALNHRFVKDLTVEETLNHRSVND